MGSAYIQSHDINSTVKAGVKMYPNKNVYITISHLVLNCSLNFKYLAPFNSRYSSHSTPLGFQHVQLRSYVHIS